MKETSLRVSERTRTLLGKIKEQYGISTYNLCVEHMANFILRNNINPTYQYDSDFKKMLENLEWRLTKSFEQMELKIAKDNDHLKKWTRNIEKTYFSTLIRQMSGLEKIKQYELDKIKEAQSKSKETEPNEYSEMYRENDKLKNVLFQIINNSKMETIGMLGREKIIINLSPDEWEKIKKMV